MRREKDEDHENAGLGEKKGSIFSKSKAGLVWLVERTFFLGEWFTLPAARAHCGLATWAAVGNCRVLPSAVGLGCTFPESVGMGG